MPRVKRRPKGEGSYEDLPGGKVRLVVTEKGKKLKGPSANSKREARDLWQEKFVRNSLTVAASERALPQKSIKALVLMLFPEDYPGTKGKHPVTLELEARWAGSTLDGFRKSVYAIGAQPIGLKSLSSLTQPYLQRWVNEWPGSPRTIKNYYSNLCTLARLFDVALPKVTLPAVPEFDGEIVEAHQWMEYYALARSDRERIAMILLFRCGMRLTEVCGVRTEHYSKKTGTLEIQWSASSVKGGVSLRKTPKNKKVRKVPIRVKWLREYLETAPKGFIIFDKDPLKPFSPNALSQILDDRARGTKFEGVSPQDLRRSAATAYALADVPIEGAAAIMGHSSKMLKEVYANVKVHVKEELMDRAFGDGE